MRRTSAIAKSTDPSLAEFFKNDIAFTAKGTSEMQKAIAPLLTTEKEAAIYQKIAENRKNYAAYRDAIVKAKNEGRADEANQLLNDKFIPAATGYQSNIHLLLDNQRQTVNESAKQIEKVYQQSRVILIAILIAAGLIGVIYMTLMIRNLLRQLGGEPDYAAAIANEIAGGNLALDIALNPNDTTSLMYSIKSMRDSLSIIVSEVRAGTHTIADASGEIASGIRDLSSRTEQQAAALEETAASIEQLTATVRQNADNARQASQLAMTATDVATKGGEVVAQVVDTMDAINESSNRIVDIISVIDSIAFQTNILALNAAVEAARAGEQGRGFAVVATEVRSLAQRSATAAREIQGLINDSVEKVSSGSKLVHDAGVTIEEVVSSVKRVNDIIGEITIASQEQNQGIGQVNEAVTQMDVNTQQNAALVQQAASTSARMENQVQHLVEVVSIFQLEQGQATLPSSAPLQLAHCNITTVRALPAGVPGQG
ncbi:methyl-accepting chemotaxis protein [Oxalobacter vibrioformis]|uniref:methyl-accepting chemotaxis protein n=1 Tax=Oxalobacter vibrioformis TaxID=933080 RepID=UPI002FCDCDFC